MSWLFSQALVEVFSEDTFSDGEPSALSSGNPTPQATDHRSKPTSASWKAKGGVNYSLSNPEIQKMWPTPKVQDSRHAKMRHLDESDDHWKSNLGEVVSAQVNGGSLNPTWVEWLMGWPLGWTDLKPLETDKSPCVQLPPGGC